MVSNGGLALQNIRILYKIALVIAALALLGIATTGLSIYRMGQADDRNSAVLTRDAPGLVWMARANATVNRTAGLLYQMIAENDASDIKATQEALRATIRDFDTRIAEAGRLLPQRSAEISRIKADYARLIEASREAQALAVENTTEANNRATLIVDKTLGPAFEALRREITTEVDRQVEALKVTSDGLTATYQSTRNSLLLILGLGVVIVAGVAMLIAQRGIAAPLRGLAGVMEVLARGDYSAEVSGQQRQDEVGLMARAVEVFKQNGIEGKRLAAEAEDARIREEQRQRDEEARERAAAEEKRARDEAARQAEAQRQREAEEAERRQAAERQAEQERARVEGERLRREALLKLAADFEGAVGGVVEAVAAGATEMNATARSMTGIAATTTQQSLSAAAATEQAATNVQTVASASEELAASINEISNQVATASRIAQGAVEEAQATDAIVQGLAAAADKIGEVVSLINTIAGQTNLLALNATIEAARAGDAGKGFAVVASEVKNLANQTAKATDEIGQQISGVQDATRQAVEAIRNIGGTVGRINEINASIASAVEEQGAATQEIARNVEQASAGTQEASASVSAVKQAADDAGHAADQVAAASGELSTMAEKLRGEVDRFLRQVRAG